MRVRVKTAPDWWSGKTYRFKAELKEGSPSWMDENPPNNDFVEGFHYFVSEKLAKKCGGTREVEVNVGDVIEVL